MYKDISQINQSIGRYFESKIEKVVSCCESSDLPSGIGIYLSRKTERLPDDGRINYNSQCYFESSGKLIVCRHIALAFAARHIGTRENNYKEIKEKEGFVKKFNAIGNHYEGEIDIKIARKNYICSFGYIGEVLHVITAKMLACDLLKESYLIYSVNHVMALRFTKKDNIIKVDFYDPNDTCSHKNIIFKDLNSFKHIGFKHLVSEDKIKRYFSTVSAIHIASLERCAKEESSQLSILADVNEDNLIIAIMYHSLCRGVFHLIENPADIFPVLKSIKNCSPAEQEKNNMAIKLLHARCGDCNPGLFMALQYGHADTVMAFVLFILESNLPEPDKYTLLQAVSEHTRPGLHAALDKGYTKTVIAYAGLILESDLPDPDKCNLIQARCKDDHSGLFMALQNDQTKTVMALSWLILNSKLPDMDKYNLLQAGCGNGASGFFMALQNGHTKTVMAFVRLILNSNLPDPDKYSLLHAMRRDGTPGLFMALQHSHAKVVVAFVGLILNSNLPDADKYNLLEARVENDFSGLLIATEYAHTETVMVFVGLILNSNLPDSYKYNLLQARDQSGKSGLLMALEEGYPETVSGFTSLILKSELPDECKHNLLQGQI